MLCWCLNFIVFFLIPSVHANDWDGFTDNLATDLAPLISLFGERLTKQFLSESTSVLDNFIFAVSPLGILTAVVSVIRVCGNSSLRAFVGRAQEGPGDAENELLSCVSETTAEMFSDGGIARVIGRPRILEVVVWDEEGTESKDGSRKIGTLRDALQQDAWLVQQGAKFQDEKGYPLELDIPNLSLNKGIDRRSEGWFYCAAVLGFALQAGVLAYAGITVFLYPDNFEKDDEPVPSYAFPLFLFGTVFLCTGMFLCAFMIERSSTEFYLHPTKPSKIYWLQPGKQDVGHQVFGAFLGVTEGPESQMTQKLEYIKSIRSRKSSSKASLLVITIVITMIGFVVQFVGLRGLHASVILAQTGSTLLMAIVRTCLRTKRIGPDENRLEHKERQLSSYKHQELDIFAFHLEEVESFSLISTAASGPLPSQSSSSSSASSIQSSAQTVGTGTRLVQTRARLAELTSNSDEHPDRAWEDLPIRLVAENLAQTIEMTVDLISKWKPLPGDTFSFDLSLVCQSRKKFVAPKVETYTIKLEKSHDTFQWRLNDHELEAIIGLRAWALLKANPNWNQNGLDRLVGLSELEARAEETDLYFHKWIYRLTEARMVPSKTISFPEQMFGFSLDEYSDDKEILVVKTENDLESMIAQDIYIQLLNSALSDLKELGGSVSLLPESQGGFLACSDRLDELVACFESSGMGSREDALLCIVPVLRHRDLLPQLSGDTGVIRARINGLIADGNWTEAFTSLRWICERCEGAEFEHSLFELGYLCRRAMVHTEDNIQSEGFKHVSLFMEGDPRTMFLNNAKPPRRDCWMLNRPEDWEAVSSQLGWIAWHIAQSHCDKQSIQGNLESFGVHEQSIPSGKANNSIDQGARAQQILLQWLTNSDDKLFNRELPGIDDRLALDWVCQNGHHALMNWLIARWVQFEKQYPGFIYHVLLWAAEARYRPAIVSLRRRGVSIDMQDHQEGVTALINKIAVADWTAVRELLEAGANVNGRDARGATPLMTASHVGDIDTVRLLLRKGAIVNTQDHGGLTPLVWSTAGNHVDIAQTLLEHGAHVNLGSLGGSTPLIAAAAENHVEMVKLLLSRGAHVDAQTADGCTALMLAARNHCTGAMKVLLDHGADIHGRNWGGPTALDWAREVYHLDGVQLLETTLARQTGV